MKTCVVAFAAASVATFVAAILCKSALGSSAPPVVEPPRSFML